MRDYRSCGGKPGLGCSGLSAIQANAIEVIGAGVSWFERERVKQIEDDAKARASR